MCRRKITVQRDRFLEVIYSFGLATQNGKQEADPVFRFRRRARQLRRSREGCECLLRIPASNELLCFISQLSRTIGLEAQRKKQQGNTDSRQSS